MKKVLVLCLLFMSFIVTGYSPAETMNHKAKNQKIYALQHILITKLVFGTNGKFFSDMKSGNISKFTSIASKVVNSDYANSIIVTSIENKEAVLIKFPEPEDAPGCYFAIVAKKDSNYKYITYEKTFSLGDTEFVGVLGGWNENGDHLNYGPRSYKTANEFIEDALKL